MSKSKSRTATATSTKRLVAVARGDEARAAADAAREDRRLIGDPVRVSLRESVRRNVTSGTPYFKEST